MTVQDFFKRYNKLAGMTGTASSDAAELRRIYKVGVFKVPTNRPGRRVWYPDRVFSNSEERFQAVAQQIVEWNKKGVPVLVGTRSIEKSERLECASRGTGDRTPDFERQESRDRGPDRVAGRAEGPGDGRDQHGRPRNRHQAGRRGRRAGGLHVIGTERHEARRIDRQLSGRCARQGDPGVTQFFICLDDEIIEAFGEKSAARIRKRLGGSGELTSLRMRRFFVAAQRKKERQHFRDRKLLMHYEKQRAEMRKNMGLNPVLG